jgi:hypothetical protein
MAILYVSMAIGFIIMLSGSFIGGMWLLFIGWFLNSGAQSYLEQHQISAALSWVYLRDTNYSEKVYKLNLRQKNLLPLPSEMYIK